VSDDTARVQRFGEIACPCYDSEAVLSVLIRFTIVRNRHNDYRSVALMENKNRKINCRAIECRWLEGLQAYT